MGVLSKAKWAVALGAAAYGVSAWLEQQREAELLRVSGRGRLAVVTGGASGIGLETVLLMARNGWRVIAVDVNVDLLGALEKQARADGLSELSVRTVRCDLSKLADIEALAAVVAAEPLASAPGGGLDCLVNCAGVSFTAPVLGASERQVEIMIGVNFLGPLRTVRALLPLLLRGTRGGSVVNVSSISGRVAWPFQALYSATKFGLEGMTDAIRREAKASGLNLRVALIEPGPVETPLTAVQLSTADAWVRDNALHPFCAGMADIQRQRAQLPIDTFKPLCFVKAGDCARAIVAAAVDPDPPARRVIIKPLFNIIFGLLRFLPTPLADKLAVKV
jgi:NAD(P)-dependent dehydrogenase (short-subunit alcohol dehydrogenase family)